MEGIPNIGSVICGTIGELPLSGFQPIPFALFNMMFPLPGSDPDSVAPSEADEGVERPEHTVADIFRMYWDGYREEHTVTQRQAKAVYDILSCRTGTYGFNISMCDTCGHTEIYANSCRNRHCPSCQGNKRKMWTDDRLDDLLPVPYYHAVLTMSDHIFPMCLYNQKVIYDLILSSSAETVRKFGRDPEWLGAEVGFFSVLHTWGQQLPMHPHVHMVIAGGGYDDVSGKWIWPKYEKDDFLFPIHAMADVFRGKFIAGLKKAFKKGELDFPGELSGIGTEKGFEAWLNRLVSKRWIAYVKAPFGGPEEVIRYVSQYTHRTAISNSRIISIENGIIRFMYKNYKKKHEVEDRKELWEETELSAREFIRRFLYHILPPNFHRIRHYGFLSNGQGEKRQEIWEYLVFEEETGVPEPGERYEGMPCPECPGILIPVVITDGSGRILKGSFSELGRRRREIDDAAALEEGFEWNTS